MTFTRSRFARLTVLAATVALTAGTLGSAAVMAQDEELDGTGVDIELIVKENINPFWVWMIQGAEARATELGATLNACWGEMDPDPETQTACIENAISRGATTILIAPSNAGVTPAIEAAREAGLLVIALDTKTDPAGCRRRHLRDRQFPGGSAHRPVGQGQARRRRGRCQDRPDRHRGWRG